MAIRLPDRWIWDSWYIWDGDVCHAFYLCASKGLGDPNRRHRYTNVGHAISRDLINWEILPDALSPSESPAFDSWTTWTGSCVRADDGKWWMFYTGSSRETDAGLVQRIGAATSDDLITWTKCESNPLLEADARYYEKLGEKSWHDEAWRDPWVFRIADSKLWHMLITARAKSGSGVERGVVGHATSPDLENWKVLEPLSLAGQGFEQYEVLQFAEVDGVPLLVFCCASPELNEVRKREIDYMDATYSLVCNLDLTDLDFSEARAFKQEIVYAGRLVQKPSGQWYLLGFIGDVDGRFVGEICDPIPVTADPVLGLVPKV